MLKQNSPSKPTAGGKASLLRSARARRLGLPSLALMLLCLAGAVFHVRTVAVAAGGAEEFVAGEVVVKLANSADLPAIATEYGLNPTPLDQFGSRPIYRLRIADGASVLERVAQLQADSQFRVVYAEPNYLVRPPSGGGILWSGGTPTDGTGAYLDQWATQKIHLSTAHGVARGAGVRIAVLDTGVDATHPALEGHLLPGYDFVDMDADPSEAGEAGQGAYGHGTHVTGLLALVAPDARIIPLRVLDANGVGNIWVLAEALEYAVNPDGDVNTNDGAQVINMSVSTPRPTNLLMSTLRKITYERIDENGHELHTVEYNNIVVAAAGNSGTDTPEYPAAESFHAMLAVAASNEADTITDFSTRGPWVGLLAPGQSITSTVPGGGYATWSGTSMAAPFAAGVAALVRSTLPNASNSTVIAHLISTSKQIEGPVQRRLDAGAALTTEVKTYVPPPTIQFSGVPPIYASTLTYEPKFYGGESAQNLRVTVTRYGDDSVPVSVDYATSDKAGAAACDVVSGQASAQCDYTAVSGTLHFAPGERFKEINIAVAKEYLQEGNEIFALTLSNLQGANLNGPAEASLIIFDNKIPPPAFEFMPGTYTVGENITSVVIEDNSHLVTHAAVITVRRTGDLGVAASVEVRTVDDPTEVPCDPAARDKNNQPYPQGKASARCDYGSVVQTLSFLPGQMIKHAYVPIVNDAYVEPSETFQVVLANPSGGTIAGTNPVTWTITDDDVASAANPIDNAGFFVRQQYRDFLGREPDAPGLAFWTENITKCADPARRAAGQTAAQCVDRQMETTSAAFFMSPEFQYTGYFVYRVYKSALGRSPSFPEFTEGQKRVGAGIIVNNIISGDTIEENKRLFVEEFVRTAEFLAIYHELDNRQYVDRLFQMTGVEASAEERSALVAELDNNALTRADVLLKVGDGVQVKGEGNQEFTTTYGKAFYDAEFNNAFVLMEYFGYMRRNPDAPGFDFWLGKLNHYGNYTDAQMVRSFVVSPEYRSRFGQP